MPVLFYSWIFKILSTALSWHILRCNGTLTNCTVCHRAACGSTNPSNRSSSRDCGTSCRTRQCGTSITRTIQGSHDQSFTTVNSALVGNDNLSGGLSDGNACNIAGCGWSRPSRTERCTVRCILRNCSLSRSRQADTISYLRPHRVILISRQSHSSQNTDNRHNDHQFDQGETLLHSTQHVESSLCNH